jgi:DNA topoisomerase IA
VVGDPFEAGRPLRHAPDRGRKQRPPNFKAIREALHTAKRVWLATDCDHEGQLIGPEILEHCRYRGQVMRVVVLPLVIQLLFYNQSLQVPDRRR